MKLITIDLDGTLLASDGSISQENREAIIEAQQKGLQVAISSGRSMHDTKEILKKAGLDCSIMTGNGAVVFHAGERIQYLPIPLYVMTEIMTKMEEIGIYYEVYTNEGVYIEENSKAFLANEMEQIQNKTGSLNMEEANRIVAIQHHQNGITYVPDFQLIDYRTLEVYKLFVLSFDSEKRKKLQAYLRERDDVSITTSGEQKIEIANWKASKGNALAFFAESMSVLLKDTVAMGDNLNDVSMFQVAGTGIAMANAEEQLKEEADYVSKHHDEDGVAFGLREWVLPEHS